MKIKFEVFEAIRKGKATTTLKIANQLKITRKQTQDAICRLRAEGAIEQLSGVAGWLSHEYIAVKGARVFEKRPIKPPKPRVRDLPVEPNGLGKLAIEDCWPSPVGVRV